MVTIFWAPRWLLLRWARCFITAIMDITVVITVVITVTIGRTTTSIIAGTAKVMVATISQDVKTTATNKRQ